MQPESDPTYVLDGLCHALKQLKRPPGRGWGLTSTNGIRNGLSSKVQSGLPPIWIFLLKQPLLQQLLLPPAVYVGFIYSSLTLQFLFIIRRNSSVYENGGTKHERLLLHHGRDRHGLWALSNIVVIEVKFFHDLL
jgi:hypothetical protein